MYIHIEDSHSNDLFKTKEGQIRRNEEPNLESNLVNSKDNSKESNYLEEPVIIKNVMKKCKYCKSLVKHYDHPRHVRFCEFTKKIRSRYECKLCKKIFKDLQIIIKHLQKKHCILYKETEISNAKKIKKFRNIDSKTKSKTCKYCNENIFNKVMYKVIHEKKCRLFYKYVKKLKVGHFQCLLCSFDIHKKKESESFAHRSIRQKKANKDSMARSAIYVHIR